MQSGTAFSWSGYRFWKTAAKAIGRDQNWTQKIKTKRRLSMQNQDLVSIQIGPESDRTN